MNLGNIKNSFTTNLHKIIDFHEKKGSVLSAFFFLQKFISFVLFPENIDIDTFLYRVLFPPNCIHPVHYSVGLPVEHHQIHPGQAQTKRFHYMKFIRDKTILIWLRNYIHICVQCLACLTYMSLTASYLSWYLHIMHKNIMGKYVWLSAGFQLCLGPPP